MVHRCVVGAGFDSRAAAERYARVIRQDSQTWAQVRTEPCGKAFVVTAQPADGVDEEQGETNGTDEPESESWTASE